MKRKLTKKQKKLIKELHKKDKTLLGIQITYLKDVMSTLHALELFEEGIKHGDLE